MFGLGVGEIVVILVVALIFIGPKKLPGLAKGLGKGVREFQGALGGITDQIKNPQKNQEHNVAQVDHQEDIEDDTHHELPEGHVDTPQNTVQSDSDKKDKSNA